MRFAGTTGLMSDLTVGLSLTDDGAEKIIGHFFDFLEKFPIAQHIFLNGDVLDERTPARFTMIHRADAAMLVGHGNIINDMTITQRTDGRDL